MFTNVRSDEQRLDTLEGRKIDKDKEPAPSGQFDAQAVKQTKSYLGSAVFEVDP